MNGRLLLRVCGHYSPEIDAIEKADGFGEDVTVVAFPPRCGRPSLTATELEPPTKNGQVSVRVLGGCCLDRLAASSWPSPTRHLARQVSCFDLVADPDLLNRHLRQGGYLVTPGWLSQWRNWLAEGGFNQESHRSAQQLAEIRRLRADQAMAFDLLAGLTRAQTEAEAVEGIFAQFIALCAPKRVAYVPVRDGKPGEARVHRCAAGGGFAGSSLIDRGLDHEYAWTPSGQGFTLRLAHRGEVLGVIEVEGLTFPEHRQDYLGIALNLVEVCSLAIASARDYENLLQSQQALEEQRVRTAQASRLQALGEMATGMAHELNQPLQGIRAFAEATVYGLEHNWGERPEEITATCRQIIGQVDRMAGIINHLRSFSRDSVAVVPERFAVAEVVGGALEMVGAQLRDHGIAVEVDIPPDLPWCHGWPCRIEQVMLNLLANALSAIEERQQRAQQGRAALPADWRARISVRGRASATRTEILLSVEDNGGGIPPESVDRIFEPFYTTRTAGRGAGLGLPIARNIVRQHQGRIAVENRPGDGAVFTVVLPVYLTG